ncbi:Spy/CpxP family protein refolding chaperone [Pseudomonas stutzeri]|nr:Spy/CpxP family protein refolding chaperone [Stutzerimonas stutzeri]
MRKTLTALLLAAALPTLAIAAPGMGDGHCPHAKRGGGYHGHMMRGLDLTPEQRQQVGAAMRENMQTQREITQRYLDKLPAADKAAMTKEQEASRAKQQKAIRDTLSPEQQKQFDALQAEREKRRAERAEFEAWKAEREQKTQ